MWMCLHTAVKLFIQSHWMEMVDFCLIYRLDTHLLCDRCCCCCWPLALNRENKIETNNESDCEFLFKYKIQSDQLISHEDTDNGPKIDKNSTCCTQYVIVIGCFHGKKNTFHKHRHTYARTTYTIHTCTTAANANILYVTCTFSEFSTWILYDDATLCFAVLYDTSLCFALLSMNTKHVYVPFERKDTK